MLNASTRTPTAHDATPSLRSMRFLRKRFRPNTWKGDWTGDLSRQTKSGKTDPFFEYKSAYPGLRISNGTHIPFVRKEAALSIYAILRVKRSEPGCSRDSFGPGRLAVPEGNKTEA